MSIGVVDGVDEAIEHINRHGTGHSEAIVTALGRGGGRVHERMSTRRACT